MITENDNFSWNEWAAFAEGEDESATSITITPEIVAIICLTDCAGQLEAVTTNPRRLALAAKSAHLALQAALTAALAGTTNTGAHDNKLEAKHLAYLQDRGAGNVEHPDSDRVMNFADLLTKAQSEQLPWGSVLKISEKDQQLLQRLTSIRHDIEHPKQLRNLLFLEDVFETLPVAANLTVILLKTVFHHIGQDDLDLLEKCRDQILLYYNRFAALPTTQR